MTQREAVLKLSHKDCESLGSKPKLTATQMRSEYSPNSGLSTDTVRRIFGKKKKRKQKWLTKNTGIEYWSGKDSI